MKKLLLSAALILFIISPATAFNVSIDAVDQTANSTSPAQYHLQIENPSPKNHTYSLSILSPKHSWFYYPSTIKIPSQSKKTTNITVSPIEKAVQQRYRFTGKLREKETGEIKDFSEFFQTQQPYKLHITNIKQDKSSVTPGEVVKTEIEIQNLDNTPVENYQVKAEYKNTTRTDTGTKILSGGTRRYEFEFKTSKNATPSTNPITYTVTAKDEIQNIAQQSITIQEVRNTTETQETENKILTLIKTFKSKNTGNMPTNTTITAEIPSYLDSITETSPEPAEISTVDGQTVYTWKNTVPKDGEFTANYTVNYWMPLGGTLLLAAGVLAIKLLGQDVQLRKTAEKEGKRIKIKLEIENTGEKTFERLELQEFIPDIATVDEKFSMNTPKIRKTSEGTKLTWNVEDLEPGDQRIIQYKIKPKVEVEEEVEFQKAEIKNMEGKTIAESNTATSEFNT